MPRDGAVVLSDLRNPTLSIVCEPCGRRGTYNVARLIEQHGDAKLTDLLQTLANCPKARSSSGARRCSKGWPYSPGGTPNPGATAKGRARKHCEFLARSDSRLAGKSRLGDDAAFTSLGNPNSNASSSKQKGMPQMKKLLLTAVAALALGAPTAKAGTWWILNTASESCVPSSYAVGVTGNRHFASPFALAAEMRQEGRLNALTDQTRFPSGSMYFVHYDGVATPYFTAKGACEEYLGWARAHAWLP